MKSNSELYTPKEVADFFKVSVKTVYQWNFLGIITPIRIHPGNRGPVRFPWEEIERFMNRHKGGKYKCQMKTSKSSKMGDTKLESPNGLEES